jgi:hypothetical protein
MIQDRFAPPAVVAVPGTPGPGREGAAGESVQIPAFRDALVGRRMRTGEILGEIAEPAIGVDPDGGMAGLTGPGADPLVPPVPDGTRGRAIALDCHSWVPLIPLLTAFDRSGEVRYLEAALGWALEWVRHFPGVECTPSSLAWDPAVLGRRALRLGHVTDAAARSAFCDDETVAILVRTVLDHARALEEEWPPADPIGGLHFVAGQIALATRFPELPGMDRRLLQARRRMEHLVPCHLTSEGVLREHSPALQLQVVRVLEGMCDAGLLSRVDGDLIDRTMESLAWFTQPDGYLVPFGGGPRTLVPEAEGGVGPANGFRFVQSRGRDGQPPSGVARTFPASGYAVIRNGWPRGSQDFGEWSYLAQACAFHTTTGRHADDLSVVWYDRGHEILIDPGGMRAPGGAVPDPEPGLDPSWSADPRRRYLESTRAHNTVEVDGRNLPRRLARPYGSALGRHGERGGVHFVESAAHHWERIGHRRLLLFRPQHWLLVVDSLWDEESDRHDFVQHFHFAPELEVRRAGERLEVRAAAWDQPLHMVSLSGSELLEPVRGQRHPELLGWACRDGRELTPCGSSGFRNSGAWGHTFATLFSFGDEPPRPARPGEIGDPEREAFRLRWIQEGLLHTLEFGGGTRGSLAPDYRIALTGGGEGGSGP